MPRATPGHWECAARQSLPRFCFRLMLGAFFRIVQGTARPLACTPSPLNPVSRTRPFTPKETPHNRAAPKRGSLSAWQALFLINLAGGQQTSVQKTPPHQTDAISRAQLPQLRQGQQPCLCAIPVPIAHSPYCFPPHVRLEQRITAITY